MSETPESGQVPEQKFTHDQMRAIIQDIIDAKYTLFNVNSMANYDAQFGDHEPMFLNIWNIQKGYQFGYLVFHDFLRRVGIGKTFLSTDFTPEGAALFEKAVADGLIKKTSEAFGIQRLTRWELIEDPIKNLERIKNKI
jgi:hypothetical protein